MNLKDKKILLIGIIVIVLVIIIPNCIMIYNENSQTEVRINTYQLYEEGEIIYNKANEKLYNLCVVNQNSNINEDYVLDSKYSNNEDYELISGILCHNLELAFKNATFDMDILKKEKYFYLKNQKMYHSSLDHHHYESLVDTKYEIIYNYIASVNYAREGVDFTDLYKNNKIYSSKAKEEINEYYEKKLTYEYEDLKLFYNLFNFIEKELDEV